MECTAPDCITPVVPLLAEYVVVPKGLVCTELRWRAGDGVCSGERATGRPNGRGGGERREPGSVGIHNRKGVIGVIGMPR